MALTAPDAPLNWRGAAHDDAAVLGVEETPTVEDIRAAASTSPQYRCAQAGTSGAEVDPGAGRAPRRARSASRALLTIAHPATARSAGIAQVHAVSAGSPILRATACSRCFRVSEYNSESSPPAHHRHCAWRVCRANEIRRPTALTRWAGRSHPHARTRGPDGRHLSTRKNPRSTPLSTNAAQGDGSNGYAYYGHFLPTQVLKAARRDGHVIVDAHERHGHRRERPREQ